MRSTVLFVLVVAVSTSLIGCGSAEISRGGDRMEAGRHVAILSLDELKSRASRYIDVEITVDEADISASDRAALAWLVRAGAVMDRLFWKQASAGGVRVRETLAGGDEDYERALLRYVDINYGVYDRLNEDEPFHGSKDKPQGATFYPEDMTRDGFEEWIAAHPEDKEAFLSSFTVIRGEAGALKAVPYSDFYGHDLDEAAVYLRQAAETTGDSALKKYLYSRADAFASNDYFDSDMAWMDLGVGDRGDPSLIEVTIGPYEVYEDKLLNLKAAFESFVTIEDEEESGKLSSVAGYLDDMEANLPVDDRYKNFSRGKASPISVVNVVYTSGDTRAGVQTMAFNLPNDERVREAKGSKKVLLKNVGEAKFNHSLVPIAKTVVDPSLLPLITFDAYFNNILMHEVSHGLGPGIISNPDGTKTNVNLALKETYSVIEECKADVLGVYNTLYLISRGLLTEDLRAKTEATSIAGIFRSVRFGIEEAHGRANMIQFNFLREAGAYTYDSATGLFGVDSDRFPGAVRDLARRLLTVQGRGDYEGAVAIIDEYGRMPAEVEQALSRLSHVPVDIRPIYTLGEKLLDEPAPRTKSVSDDRR